MKQIIIYISIVLILFINNCKSDFINFIPYSNKNCIGDEIGIGYSINTLSSSSLSTTTTTTTTIESIDLKNKFEFNLSNKRSIEWTIFNNYNNKKIQSTFYTEIGSCISNKFLNLDQSLKSNKPIFLKISISSNDKQPYITHNSYVNSFSNNKNESLLIQYFTNNAIVIKSSSSSSSSTTKTNYFCSNQFAFSKQCTTTYLNNDDENDENECFTKLDNIVGLPINADESSNDDNSYMYDLGTGSGSGSSTANSANSFASSSSTANSANSFASSSTGDGSPTTATSATTGGVDDAGGDTGGDTGGDDAGGDTDTGGDSGGGVDNVDSTSGYTISSGPADSTSGTSGGAFQLSKTMNKKRKQSQQPQFKQIKFKTTFCFN